MLSAPVKYIELGGSALGYPEPVKTLIRPSFLCAAATCATFTALAADAPANVKMAIAEHAVVGYIAARGFRKFVFDPMIHARLRDKVITTEPMESEIIQSVRYRKEAAFISRTELMGTAIISTAMASTMGNKNAIDLVPVLLFAPAIVEQMSARFRFARVADGRYALVDRPPVQDALAHLEPPVKQRETSALPAPA